MSIDSLYQQYLGRGVDPSGAATYAGWSDQDIQNAIMGSPEYAQHQQQSAPQQQQQPQQPQQQSGGGADINSIYQQYLGRGVDPSGAATYAGWNPQDIINAIKGSPEYAQSHGGGGSNGVQAPLGANPQDLANQVFSAYKTNSNYDQQLNELNSLANTDPAAYYKARIGLIGNMMGWQSGQNTGDRNTVYQNELNSYLPGAKAAGLSDAEINALITQNSASANQQNQQRIAQDAAKGNGWVNQNIPGGWGTVAGAAALGLGGAGALGLLGEGAALGAEGAGAVTQALPYTSSFDAANLFANGITDSAQLGDILTSTGIDPFLAADMGNLASQGLSADQISQILGYSYTPAELAGTGIDALGTAAGGNALADLLKNAKSVIGSSAPLMKALGKTGGASALAGALKNPTGATGGTASNGIGATFAQAKGNQNPFNFGAQTPVASAPQTKGDPFAALNVQQMTPQQQYNPLAALLKEGIYRG
jgi:hypothetical protein